MIDLHTHTTFSDGVLIPAELVRRAVKAGYKAIAITDHADHSNLDHILSNVGRFVAETGAFLGLTALSGVEITHVPPPLIPQLVERARLAGAQIVVVHGETIVEPVETGTNLAAIEAGCDILAHPGMITPEEAELAAERGVALEITTRKGHSLTNGHVAAMAHRFGAKLVINNDAHAPEDLVSQERRKKVALGAGLSLEEYLQAEANSRDIVGRILARERGRAD
jgi:histidinol phosphatase-like PHP family hydrolase